MDFQHKYLKYKIKYYNTKIVKFAPKIEIIEIEEIKNTKNIPNTKTIQIVNSDDSPLLNKNFKGQKPKEIIETIIESLIIKGIYFDRFVVNDWELNAHKLFTTISDYMNDKTKELLILKINNITDPNNVNYLLFLALYAKTTLLKNQTHLERLLNAITKLEIIVTDGGTIRYLLDMTKYYIDNTESNNEAYDEFKNFFKTNEEKDYNKFEKFFTNYIKDTEHLITDKEFVDKLKDINNHILFLESTYKNYTIFTNFKNIFELYYKYYREYEKKLKDINNHISINKTTNLDSIKKLYKQIQQLANSR